MEDSDNVLKAKPSHDREDDGRDQQCKVKKTRHHIRLASILLKELCLWQRALIGSSREIIRSPQATDESTETLLLQKHWAGTRR